MTARVLGMPKQTLSDWVRLAEKGELRGAGERPVSAEQMELARLRAELARVKMEPDISKKATAYFAKESLRSTPGSARTRLRGRSRLRARSWVSAPAATSSISAGAGPANPVSLVVAGSAMRPCWPTSEPSTPRSKPNTAGPGCGRSCWRAVFAWAKTGCSG